MTPPAIPSISISSRLCQHWPQSQNVQSPSIKGTCRHQRLCHRPLSVRQPPARLSQLAVSAYSGSPEWTLDQIAGLFIGVLLAATFYFSSKIDEVVARSQRRELGLCELCGGLNDAALCEEGKCPQRK